MSHQWSLQDAKNKLSEVIHLVEDGEPQYISKRGKVTAVVVPIKHYQNMVRGKSGLTQFFQDSPLKETPLDLERQSDYDRDVDLL